MKKTVVLVVDWKQEGRQRQNKHKHWKKGWFGEVESKLNSREIEIMNDERKAEIKTVNKLLMEHAVECVEAIKW